MSDSHDMQSDIRADDGVSSTGRIRQRKVRLAVAGALAIVLSVGAFATVTFRPDDPAAVPDMAQGSVIPSASSTGDSATADSISAADSASTADAANADTSAAIMPV